MPDGEMHPPELNMMSPGYLRDVRIFTSKKGKRMSAKEVVEPRTVFLLRPGSVFRTESCGTS
jgi:hypothetical protein